MRKHTEIGLPVTPIAKLTRPFVKFLEVESSGGIVLVVCAAIALLLANSPWSAPFLGFWKTPVGISFGGWQLTDTLGHWVNDGLMTIFFFVVGLEIKRELILGELKDRKAAALPALAAMGGMIVPALVYTMVLQGGPGSQGWGIPMATDIAFVVGFLALLGSRVPHSLKIFLLSVAIVDDIGAVLVIAIFYSSEISLLALGVGTLGFIIVAILNRLGVRRIPIYVAFGAMIWLAFYYSGVHPTVAGVLLGLLTPASAWVGDRAFLDVLSSLQGKWRETNKEGQAVAPEAHSVRPNSLVTLAKETSSPLERLELALHPWVAFAIMPLFALANAGVPLETDAILSPISMGVAFGLVVGKPVGIVLFTWLAVSVLGSRLPSGTNWKAIGGAGFLAGIGFTMSIFIAGLAFDDVQLVAGKAGTLLGSAISALLGLGLMYLALGKAQEVKLNT
jgi:NhaA family Na+:H+ antiporter